MQQADTGADAPSRKPDGRSMRAQRTRDSVLKAVRELMRTGHFRPTAAEIAAAADVSVRSIFQHWVHLRELYLDAVREPATVVAIADAIRGLPDAETVAEAFVTGQLPAKAAA